MATPSALPLDEATYRDIRLDAARGTVTLRRPLLLDLGGVAKGLAIDLAARELDGLGGYTIEAGGDLYVAGRAPRGARWRIGVRHARDAHAVSDVIQLSRGAVCTSGGYARPGAADGEHHLLDPRTGRSPRRAASATVIAPSAALADALATAAVVLGPRRGLRLLARQGVDGLIVSPGLGRHATPGFARPRAR